MKKFFTVLGCLAVFASVMAGQHAVAAEKSAGIIYVLTDRNITSDLSARDTKARNDLADWWERDLVNVLSKRGGFDAKLITDRKEFKNADGSYLLTAKILKYRAGSKAARMMVGYGAGACSMDIHYEFVGKGNKTLLAKDDGVGSGRDWRNVTRKLNENMLAAISATLGK